ncbi:MAG: tyramine oxidase, partial [Proteobacteria bacterium]|nr:tyramine oxidase [Pseudomonadota bacterium]
MSLSIARFVVIATCSYLFSSAPVAQDHPLDSLSADEYTDVFRLLATVNSVDENTVYNSVELQQPEKSFVTQWSPGEPFPRTAIATVMIDKQFFRAEVDLVSNAVTSWEESPGQGMITGIDMGTASRVAMADPRFVDSMGQRGITDFDMLRCTGLASGNFGTATEQTQRNFKVTCNVKQSEGSAYVQVEGVVVTVDVLSETVIDFVDTGIVPIPQDPWGHSEEEILARFGERGGEAQQTQMSQADGVGYEINGPSVSWDIWRFRYSVDDRPGVMLNTVEVRDGETWRSVLYEIYLSEVFVPYSDPDEGWYWRTYMDSGEYG